MRLRQGLLLMTFWLAPLQLAVAHEADPDPRTPGVTDDSPTNSARKKRSDGLYTVRGTLGGGMGLFHGNPYVTGEARVGFGASFVDTGVLYVGLGLNGGALTEGLPLYSVSYWAGWEFAFDRFRPGLALQVNALWFNSNRPEGAAVDVGGGLRLWTDIDLYQDQLSAFFVGANVDFNELAGGVTYGWAGLHLGGRFVVMPTNR